MKGCFGENFRQSECPINQNWDDEGVWKKTKLKPWGCLIYQNSEDDGVQYIKIETIRVSNISKLRQLGCSVIYKNWDDKGV